MYIKKDLTNLIGHFSWIVFNCLEAEETLRGDILLLTTKFL